MNKNIIKKQAEERLQQLKDLLQKTDITAPATHEQVKEIQQRLQEAERIITVYEYMLAQNEIAHDFNVHMKIMEHADQQEKKEEIKASLQEDVIPVKTEKEIVQVVVPPVEEKKPEPIIEEKKEIVPPKVLKEETPPVKPITSNNKKLEIGINDKYRMINDLFSHSQQEFIIAIEQLNALENWPLAKQYLDSLSTLYNWDAEKDIVKTIYRISQKRFS